MLSRCMTAMALCACIIGTAHADSVGELSDSFWQWRAREQPFSSDDIPRIERPAGYVVDWSARAVSQYQAALVAFEARWRRLAPAKDAPVALQVDYRLIGSALARVRWELLVEQGWRRNPNFYVDQSLGSVYLLLLPPPPFSAQRQAEIVERVRRIPATLASARGNLTDIRRPFAQLAVDALAHVREDVTTAQAALRPELSPTQARALDAALPAVIGALESYRDWLTTRLTQAREDTAIGRDAYEYFLHQVALLPYDSQTLLTLSRQEWARTVSFETFQETRLAGVAPAPIYASADAQIEAEARLEREIRAFLVDRKILSVPEWLHHYRNRLVPGYLKALDWLGETDDLTGPSRLDEDGISYIRTPGPDLGFFYGSTARDPRPIIVHEGVPGHYFQLCLGWHHPDPVRRHYYDSSANEGIGFYAEEMMLQAGLFDDNPRTRATLYKFMRLRALRVEVDVRLALGEFTLAQAADYLERTVPMDRATAMSEAALFASTPGQAISYQIGKLQLTQLLGDTRRARKDAFSLLEFDDYVWQNGNVPFALQRWELLGEPYGEPVAAGENPPGIGR